MSRQMFVSLRQSLFRNKRIGCRSYTAVLEKCQSRKAAYDGTCKKDMVHILQNLKCIFSGFADRADRHLIVSCDWFEGEREIGRAHV